MSHRDAPTDGGKTLQTPPWAIHGPQSAQSKRAPLIHSYRHTAPSHTDIPYTKCLKYRHTVHKVLEIQTYHTQSAQSNRLDITLAVAEALNPNKPNLKVNVPLKYTHTVHKVFKVNVPLKYRHTVHKILKVNIPLKYTHSLHSYQHLIYSLLYQGKQVNLVMFISICV